MKLKNCILELTQLKFEKVCCRNFVKGWPICGIYGAYVLQYIYNWVDIIISQLFMRKDLYVCLKVIDWKSLQTLLLVLFN